MAFPSDMEIIACDEYISLSDASPTDDVLWEREYQQAAEYARVTWGVSVARHIHTDAVARIRKGDNGQQSPEAN